VGGGCNLSTTPGSAYFTVACPGQDNQRLAKAICNYNDGSIDKSVAYDPDVMLCATVAGSNAGVKGNCDGTGYKLEDQFCAKEAATDLTRSIFARCGATTNSETGEFIKEGTYNPITEFCASSTILDYTTVIKGNTNIGSGEVKTICGTATDPSGAGKYGYADGKYTTNDFCAAQDNTVYPLCGTATYNPLTSFCAVGNKTLNPTVGTPTQVVAPGGVTPLCGKSGTNNDGVFYTDDDFCQNQEVYPLCKSRIVSSGDLSTISSTTVANADLGAGKYAVATQFCRLEVQFISSGDTPPTFTLKASIEDQDPCGSARFNPDLKFCYNNATVYPKCEGKGIKGTASSGAGADYNVTNEVCDSRGADIYKSLDKSDGSTFLVGEVISAQGGKIYPYVRIGNQTWIAENVLKTTGAITLPTNARFNWSDAQKACPDGWKLPSNDDWDALVAAAGGQNAALNLRVENGVGGENWISNPVAPATSGFRAIDKVISSTNNRDKLLIDVTLKNGQAGPTVVSGGDVYAAWWSATENVVTPGAIANDAYFKAIIDDNISVYTGIFNKLATTPNVRCIKE
jgi:uncharacterized protein (TIGR02145 family)